MFRHASRDDIVWHNWRARCSAAEIVVAFVQCAPQLTRWHADHDLRAMAAFALEDMHNLADPIEAAPAIPGLAVPDASAQALDLGDDHGFRLHSAGWSVDNPLAACFACWSRMAMWNQSRIGGIRDPGIGQN